MITYIQIDEDVIHEIHGILEVAVVGFQMTFGERFRLRIIVKDMQTSLTEEEIIQHCKEKLASYKIPEVVFMDKLPKKCFRESVEEELREGVLVK
ncbi:AMP-binding enzyme [Bacillus pacificus]